MDSHLETGYIDWPEVMRSTVSPHPDALPPRLYLSEDYAVRIRLVGQLYRHYRHYTPIMAISPGPDQDVCWQAGCRPRERYASLALDRHDGNTLKYLEEDPLFFERIFRFCGGTSSTLPSCSAAPDWLVRSETPWGVRNGNSYRDHRNRKRVIQKLSATTLTPEEDERVEANAVSLAQILAPASPEEIAELFEEAQSLGPGDPVPGSSAWWRKRGGDPSPSP
ncbi:MAG: hypothetical protein HN976_43730 [Lentisphaerae bacterium]|jgi:hypothetical protein|nr:hypothetical protein [Lentisphaerota bacterium]MBT7062074.1 hypothetical protein [Lentisphaerota bacterium]